MSHQRTSYFLYTRSKSKVAEALKEGNIDQGAFSEIGFADEFFSYLLSTDFFHFVKKPIQAQELKKKLPHGFYLPASLELKWPRSPVLETFHMC